MRKLLILLFGLSLNSAYFTIFPETVRAETVEFYANRGEKKRANGDRKGAIKDFTKAINLHSKKPEFKDLYRISVVYYGRGLIRLNDTIKKYEKKNIWNNKDWYRACLDFKMSSKMGLRQATKMDKKWSSDLDK